MVRWVLRSGRERLAAQGSMASGVAATRGATAIRGVSLRQRATRALVSDSDSTVPETREAPSL